MNFFKVGTRVLCVGTATDKYFRGVRGTVVNNPHGKVEVHTDVDDDRALPTANGRRRFLLDPDSLVEVAP